LSPYIFLTGTIIADALGVHLLGRAQGIERPGYLVAGVLALGAGFVMFSYATRSMPASVANAIWAGGSIVLVMAVGRLFLGEAISAWQYFFLAMIVAGTVGVSLLSKGQL
jgi:multidrug transporter EmrE-like cation transporter